jgi:hypothetical protein
VVALSTSRVLVSSPRADTSEMDETMLQSRAPLAVVYDTAMLWCFTTWQSSGVVLHWGSANGAAILRPRQLSAVFTHYCLVLVYKPRISLHAWRANSAQSRIAVTHGTAPFAEPPLSCVLDTKEAGEDSCDIETSREQAARG